MPIDSAWLDSLLGNAAVHVEAYQGDRACSPAGVSAEVCRRIDEEHGRHFGIGNTRQRAWSKMGFPGSTAVNEKIHRYPVITVNTVGLDSEQLFANPGVTAEATPQNSGSRARDIVYTWG